MADGKQRVHAMKGLAARHDRCVGMDPEDKPA
jgi:hypothetical protein